MVISNLRSRGNQQDTQHQCPVGILPGIAASGAELSAKRYAGSQRRHGRRLDDGRLHEVGVLSHPVSSRRKHGIRGGRRGSGGGCSRARWGWWLVNAWRSHHANLCHRLHRGVDTGLLRSRSARFALSYAQDDVMEDQSDRYVAPVQAQQCHREEAGRGERNGAVDARRR